MALDTAAPPKPRMSRRQRARLTRWAQYGVGILVVLFLALKTDWAQFNAAFFRLDIVQRMWPSVITIGLKNTLIYTALAFIFGLALGLIIAMMKLSSIGPYQTHPALMSSTWLSPVAAKQAVPVQTRTWRAPRGCRRSS